MGRYDATWGEQEREEHEALIKEVLAVQGNSARAVAYREGIDDAIQSHRPWARDVLDKVLHDGFLNRWKSVSREGVVHVVRGGRRVTKPRTWSLPRTSDDGSAFTQDALIESFTREEVTIKRDEALRLRKTYDDTVQMYDAILAFLDIAGADDIETAAAINGRSLEEWLEAEAA